MLPICSECEHAGYRSLRDGHAAAASSRCSVILLSKTRSELQRSKPSDLSFYAREQNMLRNLPD